MITLGFDPGGRRAFGVALLDDDRLQCGTVSTVKEAFEWAKQRCAMEVPVSAGIDTLLHWSAEESGWRPADRKLRRGYPERAGSIMAPNSLFGAMAVGGVALAMLLRQRWPSIVLNETHPKVLYFDRTRRAYPRSDAESREAWACLDPQIVGESPSNDHELDAAIAAWATGRALGEHWPDLFDGRGSLLLPVGPVSYRWPVSLGE